MNTPRIKIYRNGDGPALILTHGFGGTADTFSHQVEHFSTNYSVLSWDLIGHGGSAQPEDDDAYSRDIALNDLDNVINEADGDVILIGHSLGGYLNQCRAIQNPNGLRAMVLIGTGPGYRKTEAREKWNRGARNAGKSFPVPLASARLVEQHDALVMDGLEQIKCPVLQIAGSRDSAYHGAMKVLEKRVPQVESLIVPDAGHHVHATHAKVVNAAIDKFLAPII